MQVRSQVNIPAKSQVDRSTHNKNLGEGSTEGGGGGGRPGGGGGGGEGRGGGEGG